MLSYPWRVNKKQQQQQRQQATQQQRLVHNNSNDSIVTEQQPATHGRRATPETDGGARRCCWLPLVDVSRCEYVFLLLCRHRSCARRCRHQLCRCCLVLLSFVLSSGRCRHQHSSSLSSVVIVMLADIVLIISPLSVDLQARVLCGSQPSCKQPAVETLISGK